MQSEIGSNETWAGVPVHRRAELRRARVKGDSIWERELAAFKRGEHACNVYRSNARHERDGRDGRELRGMIRGSFT